jgi:hypothetical protein
LARNGSNGETSIREDQRMKIPSFDLGSGDVARMSEPINYGKY